MAKPTPKAPQAPTPAPVQPSEPSPQAIHRIPWPHTPKDLATKPRSFRIHRVSAFEWQAFVTEDGTEKAIGKPDLFDIVSHKVKGVLRLEGQAEYLAAKSKAAIAELKPQGDANAE